MRTSKIWILIYNARSWLGGPPPQRPPAAAKANARRTRYTNFSPPGRSLDFPGSLPAAAGSGPPSYFPLTTLLFNNVIFSPCDRGKFYCEIKYFSYELTSRLLRDKFFYLRVEFFLLPRGFSSSIGKYFFCPRPEDGRPMGWDKKGTANRNSPRPKRDCLV